MIRNLLLATSFAFFAASFTYAVQLDGEVDSKPFAGVIDCTKLASGSCTNPTAECTRRGGSCAVGGVDGEDGYNDPGGDNCGCQL